MKGTYPILYWIPVTLALSQAVEAGQFPPVPTLIHSFRPIPELGEQLGMTDYLYRKVIIQCLMELKRLMAW